MKVKVGIAGATGYAGIELVKLCSQHPNVELVYLTSESQKNKTVGEVTPDLFVYRKLKYLSLQDSAVFSGVDVVFLALPHQASAEWTPRFLDKGIKVIDLSAAYRIRNQEIFESFYHFSHPSFSLTKEAVYGLPEINRDKIAHADLIANPGCYPTGALIALYPLLKNNMNQDAKIIVDAKSGFSGRGKKIDLPGLFVEMNQNFYAYGIGTHRHQPEIAQELSGYAGVEMKVNFTPHVLPIDRGILNTIYIQVEEKNYELCKEMIQNEYKEEPFIYVSGEKLPQLKWIQKTNIVSVGFGYQKSTEEMILVSVIDNLMKGASGQALQNMNLMFDLPETAGFYWFSNLLRKN